MKINCLPVVMLSRLFLKPMMQRKQRSGVINLSSGAATGYYAGSSHYSATKKLADYISQSVGYECRELVDVLTARPYMVTTAMTHNVRATYTTTAEKCAKSIVDSLGHRTICYGSFLHNLQGVAADFFHPELVSRSFTRTVAQFSKLYHAAQ
jgi:17beta-estradiol 17-dehydrogenase / very-long-chain 3-oxoacyl-CoA reductase